MMQSNVLPSVVRYCHKCDTDYSVYDGCMCRYAEDDQKKRLKLSQQVKAKRGKKKNNYQS